MVSPAPTSKTLRSANDSEDLARQGTGGKSHGDRAGADVGFGTHALGNGEGFLEQTLQLAGQRLAALRLGSFSPAGDLRFAQHQ